MTNGTKINAGRASGASRFALALAIGTAALAPAALAQATDAKDTVVVTAAATPVEYEKVGNSLTVVPGQLIEDGGYHYVTDVLRQVPGLAVNRTGPAGGLTQVRIRGAEGNHTLVLLDGIDISSPDQGETDFSTLLSGDIERIEVLRGPQSGLYGSNALAGVINLITRRNIEGHYVNVGLEAGEFSTFEIAASGGFGSAGDYISAGFDALRTDGYDVSVPQASVPAVGIGGVPGDDEGNSVVNVYLRGGKALSNAFRVDGISRFMSHDAELDGQAFNFPIGGRSYDDDSHTSHEQLMVGGSGTLTLMDGRWVTIGSASHVHEERRGWGTSFPFFSGPALPTPTQLASVRLSPSGANAERTKFAVQSTFEFGPDSFKSFLTGFAENKKEAYQNACPIGPTGASTCAVAQTAEFTRTLNGLGLQYRAEIADQVFLSATARHDDNDRFQDDDTYSVAGSWVVRNTPMRLHASWGTGVTNPTFFEQFGFNPGTFTGNPNLVPEEADGWDAGLELTFAGGKAVVDVTYFESTLEHEIFTAFGGAPLFLSSPANRTTESDRSGWEATFGFHPTDNFDVVGSYTNLDATEPAGIEVRRPENQASLDGEWRIGGGPFRLNLGVTYNGEQVDTDFGTFLRTRMDPYTLVRLGAAYEFDNGVEVYARVENVTDEDYEETIGFSGMPQAVYVGVRFRGGSAK